MKENTPPPAVFELSTRGSIRHWLVSGIQSTPYAGPPGTDRDLRTNSLDDSTAPPPPPARLGEPGPFGTPWTCHDPGRNEFVEFKNFFRQPAVAEFWAFTEIESPETEERTARLWSAGAADLYVNGTHLKRLKVTRYRNPDSAAVTVPLKKGVNRLWVRLQCLGLRDTRMLFGIFVERPEDLQVLLPGAAEFATASRWIDTVRPVSRNVLKSASPAPRNAGVNRPGYPRREWPAGSAELCFETPWPRDMEVTVGACGTELIRLFEIPANHPAVTPCQGDRREAHLRYVAKAGIDGEAGPGWNAVALPLLARRLLGQSVPEDARVFADALAMIDSRVDCSDFVLAGLLRMEHLNLTTPAESEALRASALGYRYWNDEPGNDAMCFHSENHSLLFHGCQLLAGHLYEQETFQNSGRTGIQQAERALPRIRSWLDRIEARGFEEFNSGTYMPITIAAMLNVLDFSGDAGLKERMRIQIDRIYRDLALHAFKGAVISPQGRVYRDVLYPETSGTLILLAHATSAVEVELEAPRRPGGRTGDWVVFPASSPGYRPPEELDRLCHEPVSRVYRHADAQIVLQKTPAYLLTSLAVPAPPRGGQQPQNDLRPGGAGYQQHLWQASLERDCHIFVNHPGGFFDGSPSRPGYWHGNGLIPRIRQKDNGLLAIHVISDGTKTHPEITPEIWEWADVSTVRPFDLHPIPFTHAHWPTDAFDETTARGGWHFGRRGRGLIGLWCSETLVPHDDILTGRELRANAYAAAWLVLCGDLEAEGSLEAFITGCLAREPRFDHDTYIVHMRGEDPVRWWERSEPMPS
ncbi:MAG: hypothetical protein JJU05_02335 [Verrucomicrobia bacterium]|nr:hypothetical protein [Verrucomicrobiota bacterium]MCH8528016.1 hypothetical protein [Kiritimatiellia bacterium]